MPVLLPAAPDAQPVDAATMLEQLIKLRKLQEAAVANSHGRLLQIIESAAASPSTAWALYQEAIKAVQFEGLEREGTKFRDWKKKEEEQLDNPDFRNALPAHLSYLALTLRRAAGAETKDLLPLLMRHAAAVNANSAGWGSDKQMMLKPVTDGIFAKHFAIEGWAAKATDWELVPANIDGMYEKTILPELRRLKSPQIIEYWDNRLRREAEKVAIGRLAFMTERYENFRKPTLLWHRANEFRGLDQPNRAINEMLAILKAYPGHPDFSRWAAELEGLLNPQAASAGIPVGPGTPGPSPVGGPGTATPAAPTPPSPPPLP